MAKRAQIPRFGNWDKDDIQYSVYFDNARKERSRVRNNPNDPEEDHDTSGENETIEDGSSNNDHQSEEDSIQTYAANPPEKLSFLEKQQKGICGFPGLETPLGSPSHGRDDKVFNRTRSIKSFDRSCSLEMKYPKFSRHGAQTQQHQVRVHLRRSSVDRKQDATEIDLVLLHGPLFHSPAPSIPKFCSSTDNNVQDTAPTEKVCKDRAGSKKNPHDPEETHNAFWCPRGSPGNDCDISPEMPPRLSPGSSRWSSVSVQQHNSGINAGYYYKENCTRRRTPVRSRTPENENNRMTPRHSSLGDGHHKITSEDRNSTLRSSSTNSSSGRRNTESFRHSNTNQPCYSLFQKSPSVPAFTRWDETWAEGYSGTFNKVKGEKETESIKERPATILPIVPTNNPNNQNHRKQEGIFSCLKASCCFFPMKRNDQQRTDLFRT